jgi:hypothetical protein
MSIALQLPRGGASAPLCDVHHLPCHFSHDGPAKVSTYFLPQAAPGGGLRAFLRGRELAGLEAALPAGVEGAILRELQGAELVSAAAEAGAAAAASAGGGSGSGSGGGGGQAEEEAEEEECDGLFGGGGMGSDAGSGYGQDDEEEAPRGAAAAKSASGSGSSSAAGAGAASAAAAAAAASRPSGRVWAMDARFTKVTTWQHDTPATEHDMLPRALEWMRVAAVLHGY